MPEVDSVFFHIQKRKDILIKEDKAKLDYDFISFIFSKNGKDMKERCKDIFSYKQLKSLSNDVGFKITDSPTYLSNKQWLEVFQYFIIGVSYEKQKLVYNSHTKLLEEQNKIDKIHRSRK